MKGAKSSLKVATGPVGSASAGCPEGNDAVAAAMGAGAEEAPGGLLMSSRSAARACTKRGLLRQNPVTQFLGGMLCCSEHEHRTWQSVKQLLHWASWVQDGKVQRGRKRTGLGAALAGAAGSWSVGLSEPVSPAVEDMLVAAAVGALWAMARPGAVSASSQETTYNAHSSA